MKRWHKLGQLYVPRGTHPKLRSHAANPLPVHLNDDVYRIFFSGRDEQNRSSVGAVDVDIERRVIVAEHEAPFLEHGPAGSFYEAGISIGNCYSVGGQRYMLFMGWQNPPDGHWRGDIGRIRVTPALELELDTATPLMAADGVDPISLSYPWVERGENGGFLMWYGSTMNWDAGNGEMLHVLKSAVSEDGHIWQRRGVSVPYQIGLAQAFSRPTVIREGNGYQMWFSYRSGLGESYRIGYAMSDNGYDWELRLQEAGIDVSTSGWDSGMIEYPFVFAHRGRWHMLYNGNGFGKTGFGLAVHD
ncbi:hypothetical protein NBG89_27640 (plasmid) [Rhizobium sp. YTU87027]